jgi:hypothetical protein
MSRYIMDKYEENKLKHCSYKLCPVWRITSGAIQYGVPFIDLAPFIVACNQHSNLAKMPTETQPEKKDFKIVI